MSDDCIWRKTGYVQWRYWVGDIWNLNLVGPGSIFAATKNCVVVVEGLTCGFCDITNVPCGARIYHSTAVHKFSDDRLMGIAYWRNIGRLILHLQSYASGKRINLAERLREAKLRGSEDGRCGMHRPTSGFPACIGVNCASDGHACTYHKTWKPQEEAKKRRG